MDLLPEPGSPPANPADRAVSEAARDRMRRGVAENTTRAYARARTQFERWCRTGTADPGQGAAPG